MTSKQALAAAGAVLLVGGAIGLAPRLLHRGDAAAPASGTPAKRSPRDEVPAAALEADPHAADLVTREQPRHTSTAASAPSATAEMAAALGGHVARAGAAEGAIADARAGRIDAAEMGRRLREATQGHPELGGGLIDALKDERDPGRSLGIARALGGLLDDPALRQETVDALRAAPPETRAAGLIALLGRGEPECVGLAAASFKSDAPDARAAGAFLLNNAPNLAPSVADDAAATARAALVDASASAHLREEAATLLGRAGASADDQALLEKEIFEAPETSVRARSLAALEATGAADRMRADVAKLVADEGAPAPLRDMAKAYAAAHP